MSPSERAEIAIEVLQEVLSARQRALALSVGSLPESFLFDEQAERLEAQGLDFASLIQEAIETIQEHFQEVTL
ncbi:MAG TPA: hypothetical protein DCZ95_01235 [Verrucomicrobia bacterium]|nr:MAG: hypothetical protein A2X46_10845 [Lentisphaerae bacterium GWF2_57_35]HBA82691.1 hypothetical protein [Verrucomicrobiota bacterium]